MRQLGNKQTLKSIEAALVEARSQLALTATWRDLHIGYDIGTIKGKRLLLSSADRAALRELVKVHCNIDLLAGAGGSLKQISGSDRTALSQQIPNEKLSGLPVAADMVLLGNPRGVLALPSGVINLAPGMLVSCHYAQLHGLERIVVVENLSPMYALANYHWPGDTATAVMLFRGSPQHSSAAVSKALEGVREVFCFPDYDPQGLRNSFTENARLSGLIAPSEATVEHLLTMGLNKTIEFEKQADARSWLKNHRHDDALVAPMLSQRIALSQEAMVGCELHIRRIEPTATESKVDYTAE
ncbi:MAG: hypothetical protein CMK74_03805 [Pseudomonadales bacterium]|nr:hypothetical protein [Pseudomonadales bacterium]|tara:strand:- start:8663 stop:9559 length:897 start_codon:yes stop_codon:yes gene_type:complete